MGISWKKVWHFIWHDDSVLSWIVDVILAFVLVKFVIYPLLGLLLGTGYPIVAVVSGSMEHDGSFEDWWSIQQEWYEAHGFSEEDVRAWPFSNGFDKGDIMILIGADFEKIEPGDVVVFRGNSRDPIIHRVVDVAANGLQTKGDHNADTFPGLGEVGITEERVIGKALFRVPLLGWIKIWAVDLLKLVQGGI